MGGSSRSGTSGTGIAASVVSASNNNSNWLADLSVEVCKVESVEEGSNSAGGSGGSSNSSGAGGGDGGGAGDWDDSVFFGAAAAAAAACCSAGQSGHHRHDAANLDSVLLGNPNLHHSSKKHVYNSFNNNLIIRDIACSK